MKIYNIIGNIPPIKTACSSPANKILWCSINNQYIVAGKTKKNTQINFSPPLDFGFDLLDYQYIKFYVQNFCVYAQYADMFINYIVVCSVLKSNLLPNTLEWIIFGL